MTSSIARWQRYAKCGVFDLTRRTECYFCGRYANDGGQLLLQNPLQVVCIRCVTS